MSPATIANCIRISGVSALFAGKMPNETRFRDGRLQAAKLSGGETLLDNPQGLKGKPANNGRGSLQRKSSPSVFDFMRAIWKSSISFGLVSIPISLF